MGDGWGGMGDPPVKRASRGGPARRSSAQLTPIGLAQWCREACLALPSAAVDWPFGPDSDVFRIHGKMFALLMHNPRVSEHMIVNLKAEPDELPLLIATHEVIRPGFHMNKRHWITVELGPETDLGLVEELIEDSYDNVVAGLPTRLRSSLRSLGAAPAEPSRRGVDLDR
jgi:predicted DNA-binding protein (MmcQ/YjbR family)